VAVPEIVTVLQNTALAAWMRGEEVGSEWAFPIVETIHVFSLATVFGSIAMVDLRLLGITSRNSLVSSLSHEVLPWTWVAFVMAAITGSLMFLSKAETYWQNFETRAKFICMILAGVNMMVFHFGVYRRIADWDAALKTPPAARFAGATSLLLWAGVIFFGRWIGFST
jgi:hypothetical protein